MIYFTLFKLIAFQELQAIPFGTLAAIALVCAARELPDDHNQAGTTSDRPSQTLACPPRG